MRHSILLFALLYSFGVLSAQVDVVNDEPIIDVENVNVRALPGDMWHPSSFRIMNASAVELVITGYDKSDFVDGHFRLDSGLVDGKTIVIPPGSHHTVYVSYNPMEAMMEQHFASLTFISNAQGVDSLCVLWGYVDPIISVNTELSSQPVALSPLPLILSQHQTFSIASQHAFNTVVIYNSFGQEITRMNVREGAIQLPASMIPTSGMYIVRLVGTTQEVVMPLLCVD